MSARWTDLICLLKHMIDVLLSNDINKEINSVMSYDSIPEEDDCIGINVDFCTQKIDIT